MKNDRIVKLAGMFSKTLVTMLVILLIIHVLQAISMEIYRVLTYNNRYQSVPEKRDLSLEREKLETINRSVKHFTTDNKILLTYRPRHNVIRNDQDVNIYNTDQNLLWQGKREDIPYSILSWSSRYSTFDRRWFRHYNAITPEFSQNIELAVRSHEPNGRIVGIWRYDSRHQSFTVFSADGGKIGFVGANGFVPSKKELKPLGDLKNFLAWCPRDSINPKLLWYSDHNIYEIDLDSQKVENIFESSDKITDLQMHHWFYDKETMRKLIGKRDIKYRPLLCCRTDQDKHYLILRKPAMIIKVDLPAKDWSTYYANSYLFVATEDAVFLKREWFHEKNPHLSGSERIKWFKELREKDSNRSVEFYKVADDGKIESLNIFTWIMPERTSTDEYVPFFGQFQKYVRFISPLAYYFLYEIVGPDFGHGYRRDDSVGEFISTLIIEFRPVDFAGWLITLIAVAFVYWHGIRRKKTWHWLISWLLITGLFNIAGLLTYLALNHTPVIICSKCQKQRGLLTENCPRCEEPLPLPKHSDVDLLLLPTMKN